MAASCGQAVTHAGNWLTDVLHRSHTTARCVTCFCVTSSESSAEATVGLSTSSSRTFNSTVPAASSGDTSTASTFLPALRSCLAGAGGEGGGASAGSAAAFAPLAGFGGFGGSQYSREPSRLGLSA